MTSYVCSPGLCFVLRYRQGKWKSMQVIELTFQYTGAQSISISSGAKDGDEILYILCYQYDIVDKVEPWESMGRKTADLELKIAGLPECHEEALSAYREGPFC